MNSFRDLQRPGIEKLGGQDEFKRETIRPNKNKCGECNVDDVENEEVAEAEGDDSAEEAQAAKIARVSDMPSQEEVEIHNLSHLPYRSWCPHCVKGKAKGAAHF